MRRLGALGFSLLSFSEVAAAQSPMSTPDTVVGEQQSDPHPWRARPFALDAVLGIATPFGLAGIAADFAPSEYVSLSGGVGSNLFGMQLATMARVRFSPEKRNSFFLGAGYSQGHHHQSHGLQDGVFSLFTGPFSSMSHNSYRDLEWSTARWVNIEVGAERRESGGLDIRGFIGCAILLNSEDGVLSPKQGEYDQAISARGAMIYIGTAMGYSI